MTRWLMTFDNGQKTMLSVLVKNKSDYTPGVLWVASYISRGFTPSQIIQNRRDKKLHASNWIVDDETIETKPKQGQILKSIAEVQGK